MTVAVNIYNPTINQIANLSTSAKVLWNLYQHLLTATPAPTPDDLSNVATALDDVFAAVDALQAFKTSYIDPNA